MSRAAALVAVLNGLAVLAIGTSRIEGWGPFWADREAWIMGALAVTAATPVLQAFLAERGERARRTAIEREKKVESFLVAALIDIVNRGHADWQTTGVQMFRIRNRWRWTRHERSAKVRIVPKPSSGVIWTKGKGVIGRCWQTQRHHMNNLAVHFAPYATYSEPTFMALSPEKRYGLTFEDFQRLKDKYGLVVAVPIVDRKERYVGCLTADFPPDLDEDMLDTPAILESLEGIANLVREVL